MRSESGSWSSNIPVEDKQVTVCSLIRDITGTYYRDYNDYRKWIKGTLANLLNLKKWVTGSRSNKISGVFELLYSQSNWNDEYQGVITLKTFKVFVPGTPIEDINIPCQYVQINGEKYSIWDAKIEHRAKTYHKHLKLRMI